MRLTNVIVMIVALFILVVTVTIKGVIFGVITSGIAFLIGMVFGIGINYGLIWLGVLILFAVDYLISAASVVLECRKL